MSLLWINGQLIDKAVACVSPLDHGFLYGDGVWEPMRAFRGEVFRPEQHLERFFTSAEGISISIPMSRMELLKIINQTLQANQRVEGYIRVIVTRGPGTLGPDPRKIDPHVMVFCEEYLPFPVELYSHGLHTVTFPMQCDVTDPLESFRLLGQPHIVRAKIHALRNGCLDAIFLDRMGRASGTTEGDVFMVHGDIVSPTSHISTDCVGQVISELVANVGLRNSEPRVEWQSADELFLAGTSCGIIGIVQVDTTSIGPGWEGKNTHRIREAFRQLTQGRVDKGKPI